MKKMLILMTILLICGCAINKKEVKEDKKEDAPKEEAPQVEEDKYADDNPIKLGIFEGTGKYRDKKVIEDVYYGPFESNVDIGSFEVFLTDKKEVSGSSFKDIWNQYYGEYDDISEYKIGYNIKFILSDGTNFEGNFLEPDIFRFGDYFFVYLYDDVHQEDNVIYSHLEEMEDNTLITSIKLYGVDGIEKVENIILTAFTYKDDNDFKDGTYRGNSSYTIRIKKK